MCHCVLKWKEDVFTHLFTLTMFSWMSRQTQTGIYWDYDLIKISIPQRGKEEDAAWNPLCGLFKIGPFNDTLGYITTWCLTVFLSMALSSEEGAGRQVDCSFITPPPSLTSSLACGVFLTSLIALRSTKWYSLSVLGWFHWTADDLRWVRPNCCSAFQEQQEAEQLELAIGSARNPPFK